MEQWRRQGWPFAFEDDLTINYDTALNVSYVYAAVNGISSDIATLDWSVYRNDGDYSYLATEHDQFPLIRKKPYFAYNSSSFFRALIANYLLTGDGFAEILRNSQGRPIGYRLRHKSEIEVRIDHDEQWLRYYLHNDGGYIDSANMIHISDFNYNGVLGLSKIGLAKQSIEIAMRSDNTQKSVNKDGTFLGGYIKIDRVLDEHQLKKYRESFKEVYGGARGDIAILDEGATFTPFNYTMTLADAEFISSRTFTGDEILRYFRYPNHMANDLSKSSFNNIESLTLSYVKYTLRPIIVMIEEEFNSKIFRRREENTHEVRADLNSLLRGDIDGRVKLIETMWKVGAFSANDARKMEGFNPVELGDKRYGDLNKIPVNLEDEYYQNKISNE